MLRASSGRHGEWFLGCLAVAALVAVMGCDRGSPAARSVSATDDNRLIVLPEPRQITLPPLVDQGGAAFGAAAFEGKWSFVFFGYTSCPDICPVTMATLGEAERALGDDRFQGVFVSVDPARDRDTLDAYVKVFSPRFVGVTGEIEALRAFGLELAAGFTRAPPPAGAPADRYLMDHSGHLAIIDPHGRFVAILKQPDRSADIVAAFRRLAGASWEFSPRVPAR